jgi:hypothetical protein
MFNTTQPFLTDIEIALTNEEFVADLKVFYTTGWKILKVLLYVTYLIVGQLYTVGVQLRTFVDNQMFLISESLYVICVNKSNPVAQLVLGLILHSKTAKEKNKCTTH